MRDVEGATIPGLLVRLVGGDDRLLDHSRTDPRGAVLLRFPSHRRSMNGSHHGAEGGELTATVEIRAPGLEPIERTVTLPEGRSHDVVEVLLDERFERAPERRPSGDGDESSAEPRMMHAFAPPVLWDNPLDRLPATFPVELCADVVALFQSAGTQPLGPLSGLAPGLAGNDFRTSAMPLIKRAAITRVGTEVDDSGQLKRYLVRVRQEWTFLGYTLGELKGIHALDPGEVVRELQRTATRTLQQRELSSLIATTLNQLSSVDSVVALATSPTSLLGSSGLGPVIGGAIGAGIGSIGGPVGAIVGGGIGAFVGGLIGGGGVGRTVERTVTNTTTTVNSLLRTSQSQVNQLIRTLSSALRSVESLEAQVSPLLSRVTNLLRWTMYENYAVCTQVEDVLEIETVRIATLVDRNAPLFADEDVVDYERIFSPGLLEPKLRGNFNVLRRAIAERHAAEVPVQSVELAVEFGRSGDAEADLTATLQGVSVEIPLNLGATSGTGIIRLPMPMRRSELGEIAFSLRRRASSAAGSSLQISQIRFRFVFFEIDLPIIGSISVAQSHVVPLSGALRVNDATPVATSPGRLRIPPAPSTATDPLFRHINRNRTHYLGLLMQRALVEPGLRDDAAQLAAFDGSSDLWRLPIIGFEGDRALILKEIPPEVLADEESDAHRLLEDPGSATVIQIAAPGAYSEALQGVLQLADAAGKLHPALAQPLGPAVAVIDRATGTATAVELGTGPLSGGGNGGLGPVAGDGLGSLPGTGLGGLGLGGFGN